jgi:hypothetical protein
VTDDNHIDLGCGEFIDESGNRFKREFIHDKWQLTPEQEGAEEAASHDEAANEH